MAWHPSLDDPHDYGIDYRGWSRSEDLGCPVGCCQGDCSGLGRDDSSLSPYCSTVLQNGCVLRGMTLDIIPSNAISGASRNVLWRGNRAEYRSQLVGYSALIRDAECRYRVRGVSLLGPVRPGRSRTESSLPSKLSALLSDLITALRQMKVICVEIGKALEPRDIRDGDGVPFQRDQTL
jgi:hypothetical protein